MPNDHHCRCEAIPVWLILMQNVTNPQPPTVTNGGCRIASPSARPTLMQNIANPQPPTAMNGGCRITTPPPPQTTHTIMHHNRKGEPILPSPFVNIYVAKFALLSVHQGESWIASPLQPPFVTMGDDETRGASPLQLPDVTMGGSAYTHAKGGLYNAL